MMHRLVDPLSRMSLAAVVGARAETIAMMRLAEAAFSEWNEPGEEIYDEAETR
jgi:hypothetical protein